MASLSPHVFSLKPLTARIYFTGLQVIDGVPHLDFNGIDAQFFSHHTHLDIAGKAGMGETVAAHGSRDRIVRKDAPGSRTCSWAVCKAALCHSP